jgi:DNA polymerase-3 subunit epsilon
MSDAAEARTIASVIPLERAEFTVLDLETTGGAPPEHRITEIAAYRVSEGKVVDEFVTLIDPERSIPSFITKLTGINKKMVKGSPTSRDALPGLMQFLGDSVLVAHHSKFDRGFLEHELSLASMNSLGNMDLCTSRLARRIVPWLPSKSLGGLAAFFGIEIPDRHRASSDALATVQLLMIFLEYLRERGLVNLHDVLAFQHGVVGYPSAADMD